MTKMRLLGEAVPTIAVYSLSFHCWFHASDNYLGSGQCRYDFSHEIQVGVSNPTDTLVASVLDTAVDAGHNSIAIKSVSFSLSTELSSEKSAESRRVAANDAFKTAHQLTSVILPLLGNGQRKLMLSTGIKFKRRT